MSTSHSPSRRNSAATDMTLTTSNTDFADKMKSHGEKVQHFDDDEKTLSDLALDETSSNRSKTKLSKAMTQLKSKLKAKDEKSTQKQKTPLPADYYPNTLRTFEALSAASRI
ncbi:hypothetical protein E0Z10_g6321 [Xylaria hypoxylon]|uniref:Uncharacterized protein n=1 Tax=Xylaria hypoxylon TaxID=37992 RepID=A0A4Z0Z1A4_9PEZI|nr:hypothetical protein E0Z10_g6321 [Xylaria hypoxylon]